MNFPLNSDWLVFQKSEWLVFGEWKLPPPRWTHGWLLVNGYIRVLLSSLNFTLKSSTACRPEPIESEIFAAPGFLAALILTVNVDPLHCVYWAPSSNAQWLSLGYVGRFHWLQKCSSGGGVENVPWPWQCSFRNHQQSHLQLSQILLNVSFFFPSKIRRPFFFRVWSHVFCWPSFEFVFGFSQPPQLEVTFPRLEMQKPSPAAAPKSANQTAGFQLLEIDNW